MIFPLFVVPFVRANRRPHMSICAAQQKVPRCKNFMFTCWLHKRNRSEGGSAMPKSFTTAATGYRKEGFWPDITEAKMPKTGPLHDFVCRRIVGFGYPLRSRKRRTAVPTVARKI
jgi:hypothetical protein